MGEASPVLRGAITAPHKYNKMSPAEIGLIDTCNKFKGARHHASREKRPLRYPPYGPEAAIPKEVPILGAETRVGGEGWVLVLVQYYPAAALLSTAVARVARVMWLPRCLGRVGYIGGYRAML